jgi:hypothetical protein
MSITLEQQIERNSAPPVVRFTPHPLVRRSEVSGLLRDLLQPMVREIVTEHLQHHSRLGLIPSPCNQHP